MPSLKIFGADWSSHGRRQEGRIQYDISIKATILYILYSLEQPKFFCSAPIMLSTRTINRFVVYGNNTLILIVAFNLLH